MLTSASLMPYRSQGDLSLNVPNASPFSSGAIPNFQSILPTSGSDDCTSRLKFQSESASVLKLPPMLANFPPRSMFALKLVDTSSVVYSYVNDPSSPSPKGLIASAIFFGISFTIVASPSTLNTSSFL
uniref:(northern house mosquito) hypothetical protein n=1 Tax=Culex pipiens TaxID=7175 RepID=A0A8D8NK83_CULPI